MDYLIIRDFIYVLALGPLVYYTLALVTAISYIHSRKRAPVSTRTFAPPASILKPVRGLDHCAYENFASFCRLDYPEYEIVFCVSDTQDPVIPVVEKIQRDFPERQIRLLIGAHEAGASSKVNKLCRLAHEAKYDLLVISDSDVRVGPNYLRGVVAPFEDPGVGAVTALFRSDVAGSLGATLDGVGSGVEFATAALLAQWLEGIRFTLGATMATTKARLSEIGGFEAIRNHYVDDYELGSRIAALGYSIKLAQDPVLLVYPRETLRQFIQHELRWTIGLRNVRAGGHAAVAFTFGLPWTILAAAVAPSQAVAALYILAYLFLRYSVYGVVGIWALNDPVARKWWILAPVRDAIHFGVWVASFFSNKISWRGLEFQVKRGLLIPVTNGRETK
jgi:ceramide glucosyltransferase